MLNPSLFYYIINIKNGMLSWKCLISSIYVTSHLKTLITFFSNKIKYTWVIFCNSLRSHLSTSWQKEILSIFFCSYWNAQVFNCTLRHIWNGRFGLFPKNNIFFWRNSASSLCCSCEPLILCKSLEKSYKPFFRKNYNWNTDILTYWPGQFHRTLPA